jgi:hypothetical protein
VNYSVAAFAKSRGRRVEVEVEVLWRRVGVEVLWAHRTLSGAHRTVRCLQPEVPSVASMLLCRIQHLVFLLAKCEPFAPV